jgi:hypothetical protein
MGNFLKKIYDDVLLGALQHVYETKNSELRSRDSSVCVVMDYELDDPGSIPGSARIFSSPQHPD